MAWGALTQNGWASSVRAMWNFSPSIVLISPSNTVGKSVLTSCRFVSEAVKHKVGGLRRIGVVWREDVQRLGGFP